MYCSKCGKELTEEIKFCPGCGAAVNEDSKNTNETLPPVYGSGSISSSLGTKPFFIASAAGTILMIILTLTNWVKFSVPTSLGGSNRNDFSYSLFSIFKIMKNIKVINQDKVSIIGDFFILVLFAVWIAALAAMIVFCFNLFKNKDKCVFWGKIAMDAAIVLSVLSIVLIFIISKIVNNEVFGFEYADISTTVLPFIVGILAIAGRVYLMKMLGKELSGN